MKKLTIAAAIVCAAAGAYAAAASWEVSSIYDYADISKEVPSYLVMGENYATYMVVATVGFGVDEMKTALGNSDFSWMTTQRVDTPKNAMTGGVASGLTSDIWFGNEEMVNAFAVVFNNSDYAKDDYAYVTAIDSKMTGGEGQAATLSFDGLMSYDASNWTQVGNVPEPTSGLLLLLGVAGLAHTCSHFASQSSGYALG